MRRAWRAVAALSVMSAILIGLLWGAAQNRALASEDKAWEALSKGGAIVLFRHALAPGTGDPPGFRIGVCATQRNLNAAGREQAKRIGAAFQSRNIAVGKVLSSQWCRCRETAELAFPGRVEPEPAFNSFFEDETREPAQTAAARKVLLAWTGPGALVVSTHQVNISALTGTDPSSGEGIVLVPRGGKLAIVGRIRP